MYRIFLIVNLGVCAILIAYIIWVTIKIKNQTKSSPILVLSDSSITTHGKPIIPSMQTPMGWSGESVIYPQELFSFQTSGKTHSKYRIRYGILDPDDRTVFSLDEWADLIVEVNSNTNTLPDIAFSWKNWEMNMVMVIMRSDYDFTTSEWSSWSPMTDVSFEEVENLSREDGSKNNRESGRVFIQGNDQQSYPIY